MTSLRINVAAQRNAIGSKKWVMIDGWSEAVLDFIQVAEADNLLG